MTGDAVHRYGCAVLRVHQSRLFVRVVNEECHGCESCADLLTDDLASGPGRSPALDLAAAGHLHPDPDLWLRDHRLRIPLPVSYTHLRAHETDSYLVCRLLLE